MRTKRTTSRFLSILLCLAMVAGLLPTMALAAGGSGTSSEPYEVATYDDLKRKMEVSAGTVYIKLTGDIDTKTRNSGFGLSSRTDETTGKNEMITVQRNVVIHLDLNGHTLNLYTTDTSITANIADACFIDVKGTLNIKDSVGNGKLTGYNGTSRNWLRLITVDSGGKLNVESGTLSLSIDDDAWPSQNTVICNRGGEVTISGGTFVAPTYRGRILGDWNIPPVDYALDNASSGIVTVSGGTFNGPVRLCAKEMTEGEPMSVITGGTFNNSVFFQKEHDKKGKLNVQIKGGTYYYTPGRYTLDSSYIGAEGEVVDDPYALFQFATYGFRPYSRSAANDGYIIDGHDIASYNSPNNKYAYDLISFCSLFPDNAVIVAEGQKIDFVDENNARPYYDDDAIYSREAGIYSYRMLYLINSLYRKITVYTSGLSDLKLTPAGGEPIALKGATETATGTIKPGNDGKTFTVTATVPDWMLALDSLTSYSCEVNVSRNGKALNTNGVANDAVSFSTTPAVDKANKTVSMTVTLKDAPAAGDVYTVYPFIGAFYKVYSADTLLGEALLGNCQLTAMNALTEITLAPVELSAALTPGALADAPTVSPAYTGYTVESTTWYVNSDCTTPAASFTAGTDYYAKITLKPKSGYKFASDVNTPVWCDDDAADYSRWSPTVAGDGSSLSFKVKSTARAALTWDAASTDTTDVTYILGNSSVGGTGNLTLQAKAVGGDTTKEITYEMFTKKAGADKATRWRSGNASDVFSVMCSFTEAGSYDCWFTATRGNITIESTHFTVTVKAPALSITNQSGDVTVKQNAGVSLWVRAAGLVRSHQWQVYSDGAWTNVSADSGMYYYKPATDTIGSKTYRCIVTDSTGQTATSDAMTVTVIEDVAATITPAIPFAAVNGDVPDLETEYPDHIIEISDWYGIEAEYNVTEGDTFEGVATYALIPRGYYRNAVKKAAGEDWYYDSYNGRQKTPTVGDISYTWRGTTKYYWAATSGDFTPLDADEAARITIPNCSELTRYDSRGYVDESATYKYYVEITVKNRLGDVGQETSSVVITFNVSPKHTHDYTDHYAKLDETKHTAYCACGASQTEAHDALGTDGACSKCGYAPAKSYSITVTGGAASSTSATAGMTITLTANAAPAGQKFDKWVGNVEVTTDVESRYSFVMPAKDVTLAAMFVAGDYVAHTHNYGAWTKLNEYVHYRTCTSATGKCDMPAETTQHSFTTWTKADDDTHTSTCDAEGCNATKTVSHIWISDPSKTDAAPTLTATGTRHLKCFDCTATKTEIVAKLTAIGTVDVSVTAPVRGGTPADAYTVSSAQYYIDNTVWTPTVSSTFAGGTKYTVKVSLEAMSGYAFGPDTQFTVNGQTAAIVGSAPGADGSEMVTLSYAFPATSSGSSGGGGGGVSTYAITVKDSRNGTVTADRKTASSGATVTLTVTPDQGWTLETLTATNAGGKELDLNIVKVGEKYTFKMPGSNVTVTATFMEDNTILNYFVDVPTNSYYYDAVLWAVDKGITKGTDDSHFDPNGICTRAQAVTFLWRAAGSPAPKSTTMPFTDVPAGSYYYSAVLWAVENGITKGTGATEFSPNQNCSRAQIVTFLWRSENTPAAGSTNPFTDVAADAYYADAVLWAVKEGVTKGTGDTTFSPSDNCTRAQIVTFIWRCMK